MAATPSKKSIERVIIRPYSEVIFLYPTAIMAIACGIWVSVTGDDANFVPGLVFTLMFFFNLSVIAFDYTRLTSVVIVLLFVIVGLLSSMYPAMGDFITDTLKQPLEMNSTFYWVWAICFALLFLGVFIKARFNYWEVKNNELLHHHGMLGDVERWSAPHMRISKEISDVMEYFLLRSGRLVLVPAGESRAIVIDNVPGISRIETQMQDLLSKLRVADGD